MNNIYIFVCADEIKIGVSKNVEERLKAVQTGRSEKVYIYHNEERDDAYKLERLLFKKFAKYRKEGEWFKGVSPEEARIALYEFIF